MRSIHIAAAAALLVAPAAWAQTQSTTTVTVTSTTQNTTTSSGSFAKLSPGQQTIARSLFDAQQPTATGPAPLSLDQIAATKGKEGWGEVFQQMKAEGLVDAKNLGQLVSTYHHSAGASSPATTGGTVVITSASGQTIAARSGPHGVHGTKSSFGGGDHDSDGVTTAWGSPTGGGTAPVHGVGAAGVAHGGGEAHIGGGNGHGR